MADAAEISSPRARAQAPRSKREDIDTPARGEPARAQVRPNGSGALEFKHPLTGEIITRSLTNTNDSPYFIPPDIVPDGMTYEWKRKQVYGEPDLANMLALQRNGWREVPKDRHPERALELDGLVLMECPTQFVQMSREEDRRVARRERSQGRPRTELPSGFTDEHPSVRNANFARRDRPEATDPSLRPKYPTIDE